MDKEKIWIDGFDLLCDIMEFFFLKCNPREDINQRNAYFGPVVKSIVDVDAVLNSYGKDIDEELHVFFDETVTLKPSFLKEYYAKVSKKRGFVELEQLIDVITRDDILKERVIRYYFGEVREDEEVLKEMLIGSKSRFPQKIQNGFVSLILFTEDIKEKLINELKMVGEVIRKEHRKNQLFLEEQREYNTIENIQFVNTHLEEWYKYHKTIKVRFSCMNPKIIWWNNYPEYGRLILGTDYERMMESLWNVDISFPVFAAAMGDELRYKIVQVIKTTGEIGIKDISSMLHIPLATVVYHMDKLKEARVVRYRMQGKTVLYSINPASFYQAIQELRDLIKEEQ